MADNDNAQRERESSERNDKLPVISNEKFIQLSRDITQLDLTGLTEQQVQELKVKHAETMIETNKKATELVTDVAALRESLDTMANAATDVASQEGQSVTIKQRQKNVLGETEIIIGNTPAARSGMLGNNTMIWFALAIAVIIAIVIIAVTRG